MECWIYVSENHLIYLFVKYSLLAAMQKDVSKSAITTLQFTTEDKHLIKWFVVMSDNF